MAEPIATVGDLAGICGHDGTNWEKILIDSSKRLVVAVASAIANDVQVHGYYDGAWQKSPIAWGFSGVAVELVSEDNVGAGLNDLFTTEVPAGEVHFYYAVAMLNLVSTITVATWMLESGGTGYIFYRYLNIPAGYAFVAPNPTVVGPGDRLRLRFSGCVAGDDLRVYVTGYKMDLDL